MFGNSFQIRTFKAGTSGNEQPNMLNATPAPHRAPGTGPKGAGRRTAQGISPLGRAVCGQPVTRSTLDPQPAAPVFGGSGLLSVTVTVTEAFGPLSPIWAVLVNSSNRSPFASHTCRR